MEEILPAKALHAITPYWYQRNAISGSKPDHLPRELRYREDARFTGVTESRFGQRNSLGNMGAESLNANSSLPHWFTDNNMLRSAARGDGSQSIL
jgi:hypothetical protein